MDAPVPISIAFPVAGAGVAAAALFDGGRARP